MCNTMKRAGAGIVTTLLFAATAAAQDIRPASGSQPANSTRSIQAQPGTSPALAAVLTRSCGDCHSNSMVPGWYTRVFPFSTLMARGATKGRKALNFSEWSGYSPEQQRAFLIASCADATLGKMPMKSYLRFRGDARLSAGDVATICLAAGTGAPTTTTASQQARKAP